MAARWNKKIAIEHIIQLKSPLEGVMGGSPAASGGDPTQVLLEKLRARMRESQGREAGLQETESPRGT